MKKQDNWRKNPIGGGKALKRLTLGRKLMKRIISITLCMAMTASVGAVSAEDIIKSSEQAAFSLEQESIMTGILEKLNAEYGTNFHIYTDTELQALGLKDAKAGRYNKTEPVDVAEYEKHFRYVAEVMIPLYEKTTCEAEASIKRARARSIESSSLAQESDSTLVNYRAVIAATKPIQYATAAVEADTTKNEFGASVWGVISNKYCLSNIYQRNWFMADPNFITATHIDGRRTINWSGTGDYGEYYDGTQHYAGSGTQYAEMYIGDYV